MRLGKIYLLLGLLVLASSCGEKPDPVTVIETPVFSVEASLEGEELTLSGGVDGYFLHTEYVQEPSGLYRLIGEFRPAGCETCTETLRIEFRDLKPRANGESIPIDSVLMLGPYGYYEPSVILSHYVTRFTALPSGEGSFTYQWDLGDGTIRSKKAFNHIYTQPSPSTYQVHLSVISDQGCSSELRMPVTVPKPICFPSFTHIATTRTHEVAFNAFPSGAGPFTYSWTFGDGQISSLPSPNNLYDARGVYSTCLTVTDNSSCEATICRNVQAGRVDGCPINLAYDVTPVYQGDSLGYGKVVVTWVDAAGVSFSSAAGEQPAESFFELLDHEPYEVNPQGIDTEQVNVRLKCTLFDGAGVEKELVITEGTMAIGYR